MDKTDIHTASPHHLPAGTVLCGRYRIDSVLGEGGFGITYKGFDETLELEVAVKEYFPKGLSSRDSAVSNDITQYTGAMSEPFERGRERFLAEARTMAKMLQSPEIAQVRDYFEENNTAYIIMEYIDGKTLTELVSEKGGRLPGDELFPMVRPLFSALFSLHENDLVHKDISPENIMIVDGRVKLLDFGCARADGGNATANVYVRHGFSPIEQYVNSSQGPRTDVYALAASIYYCLTGREPQKAVERSLNDELAPPRELGADITEREEKALLCALGVKPNRRFQSMADFERALYGEVEAGIPEDDKPADNPQDKLKKSRKVYITSGAVLAAAVLVCVILFIINRYKPEVYNGPSGEMVTFDEREIFSDAVTVTSADEFLSAADDIHVQAIIIDGDITINPEEHTLVTASLKINENASLTVDPAISSEEHDYGIYMESGTYLVNNGTMTMINKNPTPMCWLLNGKAFTLINHGEIKGSMFLQDGNMIAINDGVLTTHRYSGFAAGSLWNFGTINLEREPDCSNGIEIQGTHRFYNAGSINVYDSFIKFVGEGELVNAKDGRISLFRSFMINEGNIVNDGIIEFDADSTLDEAGSAGISGSGEVINAGEHKKH